MNQPKPIPETFDDIFNDIEKGLIKIPQFQRDFVWSINQSAQLIDSILKGYPIGTFIFWKTKEELRSIRNIGNLKLLDIPKGDFVKYILDGQQRITSIYAAIKGAIVERENNKFEDFSKIYVNLLATELDECIVLTDVENLEDGAYIQLSELYEGKLSLAKKYNEKFHEKIEKYSNCLKTYNCSTILVEGAKIDEATEIFSRLNVGGKKLSVFEIMVAKTYCPEKDFDLSEKYDKLINDLEDVKYETVPNSTLLQSISVCLVKECTKKHILKLDKIKFVEIYDKVEKALKECIDYFRSTFRIPVSQLLPYDALIVPFTYFFFKNNCKKPNATQEKYLKDYFWRVVLTSRFFSSLEQRIGQDIKRIDEILENKKPYYEEKVDISKNTIISQGYFTTTKGYIKGLLCILAYQRPLSFRDNAIINIDNACLKQANSRNYHHFFPKAYLQKQGIDDFKINHIANITIVDDFLNKREIKDKAPSVYMQKYINDNKDIVKTLKTHLINNIYQYGIIDNDYEKFFNARIKAIVKELKDRIIPQEFDTIEN